MTESRAQTPVLGKIAVAALILMVVGGYIFEAFVNTYGGLDFSIYRMGAMTIFDNEGFDKELYGRAMVSIGCWICRLPTRPLRRWSSCRSPSYRSRLGMVVMVLITAAAAWWLSMHHVLLRQCTWPTFTASG